MKGLILSGGHGTRLRPLTYTSAKQLVPVANKPILYFGLEAMADAGIRDVGIVVGDTHMEIRQAVGDGSQWGLNVTYIQQEKPLGLAHAVLVSEKFLADDRFVMYLGDNIIRGGVRSMVELFEGTSPNAQILLAHVPNPQEFGVAELNGAKVVRLVEKPKEPKSDLALVGVYIFDRSILDAARRLKPSKRGELEITDAIQMLIDEKRDVRYHLVDGWWKDTGKVEDLLDANRLVLDEIGACIEGEVDASSQVEFKVRIEEGARVVGSRIRGPAVVGKGAVVENSYIGPFTALGPGVTVRRSEIEHSIVMENSSIESVPGRICDSLIGKEVKISPQDMPPRAYRFVLGERSQVNLF